MKLQAEIEMKREKAAAELQIKREEMEMKMQMRMREMQLEAELRGVEAMSGVDVSATCRERNDRRRTTLQREMNRAAKSAELFRNEIFQESFRRPC